MHKIDNLIYVTCTLLRVQLHILNNAIKINPYLKGQIITSFSKFGRSGGKDNFSIGCSSVRFISLLHSAPRVSKLMLWLGLFIVLLTCVVIGADPLVMGADPLVA